jgi:hypothetical protein
MRPRVRWRFARERAIGATHVQGIQDTEFLEMLLDEIG